MPFIVTTRRLDRSDPAIAEYDESRRAVATLDKAARYAHSEAGGEATPSDFSYDRVLCLVESGGTVGPLPDGTVIEVVKTTWATLGEEADPGGEMSGSGGHEAALKRILDAFNARVTA